MLPLRFYLSKLVFLLYVLYIYLFAKTRDEFYLRYMLIGLILTPLVSEVKNALPKVFPEFTVLRRPEGATYCGMTDSKEKAGIGGMPSVHMFITSFLVYGLLIGKSVHVSLKCVALICWIVIAYSRIGCHTGTQIATGTFVGLAVGHSMMKYL